ncbi:two-component system, NarL family, sensor histidine kinase DesK [Streptomyces zhaozhouensis]|uniref:Two-component system, NarL family, sensor histidine kinase DesK n=1 Tax=Streptomyces zhaozhouensis TaxID=1300267 RepID=A0A286DUX9_9ACTN|nr:sensor histidine kinase [Streptomyces zhaozhouensis]SOD62467.1 two-component system, NarL family, sensor histidine kinase DesK [Streptomyces zhaozhouensis]
MRLPRWWSRMRHSSHQRRVHAYTRSSLYFVALMELVSTALILFSASPLDGGWVTLAVCVLVTHHTLLMLFTTRDGLDHYLHQGERPVKLLIWTGFLTCVTSLVVGGGIALDLLPEKALPVAFLLCSYFGGPVALLVPLRRMAPQLAAPLVCCLVAFGLQCPGITAILALAVVQSVVMVLIGATFRTSAWTLRVLDRVDAARETEKRLAVAEERLRFGRDLHDVLGRNLSVIALKSELAAQLARRGSPAAVDQLAEVQRIARESQREIREVVRGYRQVDLRAELAGARGVLEAADIRCALVGVDSVAPALSPKAGSALGWVVREGVTNVLRHSSAELCTITFGTSRDGRAELSLENDGAVARETAAAGTGTGLAGLRERLSALGGTLSAERAEGGIFRLTARVPLDAEDSGPDAPVATGAERVGAGDAGEAWDAGKAGDVEREVRR